MRTVQITPPSFPSVQPNQPFAAQDRQTWQVLCGDDAHWRLGFYSPAESSRDAIRELETHDCPELFLLQRGELTLVLDDGAGIRELPLSPGCPVLVTAAHAGYCPRGAHTGVALVVERDRFTTCYRDLAELQAGGD